MEPALFCQLFLRELALSPKSAQIHPKDRGQVLSWFPKVRLGHLTLSLV